MCCLCIWHTAMRGRRLKREKNSGKTRNSCALKCEPQFLLMPTVTKYHIIEMLNENMNAQTKKTSLQPMEKQCSFRSFLFFLKAMKTSNKPDLSRTRTHTHAHQHLREMVKKRTSILIILKSYIRKAACAFHFHLLNGKTNVLSAYTN